MPLPLQELFEELGRRVNSQHDYNHILSGILQYLNEQAAVPFVYIDGTPYVYDPSRNKLLSVSRPTLPFSRYGSALSNCYMKSGDVSTSGEQGILMSRKGTITSLVCKSREHGDYYMEVRKNGSATAIASVRVINGVGVADNINIDFDQFDNIQLFIQGSYVDHPIATLEWAWRSE